MINIDDAKYVLQQLRNIPYYDRKISSLKIEIDRIETLIAEATSPASPNGGEDVMVKGKMIRVKVPSSHTYDSGKAITDLITRQMPLESMLRDFEKLNRAAKRYRSQLLKSEDAEFVKDSISGMKYRDLEKKYHITNAYDKLIRIIQNRVRSL